MRFAGVVRIVGVWLIALGLVSFAYGGVKGFLFVFLIYGMLMTLPAIFAIATVSVAEEFLIQRGKNVAALVLGPAVGLAVPGLLFLISPNKNNAAAALPLLFPVTIGTGLLWSASLLLRLRYTRER